MIMKKELFKNFDFARRFGTVVLDEHVQSVVSDESAEVQQLPKDSLLSIIYAEDARTKLPTGDLNYYVSDKANPQVKQFILDNLMQDVSSAARPATKDLPDDLLLELSQKPGETIEQYAQRLNTSIARDKWIIDQSKQKPVDVPAGSGSPVPVE